jgi:hypothetical protein
MIMKINYDRKHILINMKVEDFVLLRCHKNYNIFVTKILKKKLSQQYVDSFKMLEKIENLIYCMKIWQHWLIHSVVSITQHESMSNLITDSFSWSRSIESKSIHMKNDTKKIKFFEIKRLIDKKSTTRREIKCLVRWKDWESQYDEWKNVFKLQNVKKFIDEYDHNMNSFITLFNQISQDKIKIISKRQISLMINTQSEKFDITIFKSINILFFEFIMNNLFLTKVIMTKSTQNQ